MTREVRRQVGTAWVVVVLAVTGAWVAAERGAPRVEAVSESVEEVSLAPPRPRAVGAASNLPSSADSAVDPLACEDPSPGPSWACRDGKWQLGPPAAPLAAGGGRTDRAAGCLTEQPGPSLVCQDGLWVIAGANPARPTSTQSSRDECPPPAPGSDWTCEDGAWVPPDEPGRQPVPPARPEPGDPDQVPPTPPEPGDPEPVPPAPPGPGTPDPVPPTPPQPGGPDPVPPAPPSPGQPVPIPPAPPQPPTPIPPAAPGA